MSILYKLDITQEHCPITFVKVKLFLERLNKNDKLEVLLKKGEPLENIPNSLKEQGYKVLNIEQVNDNIFKLIIEK